MGMDMAFLVFVIITGIVLFVFAKIGEWVNRGK